jgi:hypothetical protein
MKPRPASLNNLRAPEPSKPDAAPEGNYNVVGIVLTTVATTGLVLGTMWWLHQKQLKNEITTLKDQVPNPHVKPSGNNQNI